MKKYLKYTILATCTMLQVAVLTGCGGGGSGSSSTGTGGTNNSPSNDNSNNSTVTSHYAYITNIANSGITKCLVSESDGGLTNCAQTATGFSIPNGNGITISRNGKYAYISSSVDTTNAGAKIAVCSIESSDGSLTNCNSNNESSIYQPYGLNTDLSGNNLYVSNFPKSTVSVCAINQADGSLSGCHNTGSGFKSPSAIAVMPNGKYAYVLSYSGVNAINICQISSDGELNDCTPYSNNLFSRPVGLTIDPTGKYAYAVNGFNSVLPSIGCTLSTDGSTFESCNNNSAISFSSSSGMALDANGKYVYITSSASNSVSVCSVLNNQFENCKSYTGEGNLNQPWAIAIH